MSKRKLLIEVYTQTQVYKRYYDKMGKDLDPIPAYKSAYQDNHIDLNVLKEVIDEAYHLQCAILNQEILREAKKRKK